MFAENTTQLRAQPIAGRIAMYTQGEPKNQNGATTKAASRPYARDLPVHTTPRHKEVVPALRSHSNKMPGRNSTPKRSSPRIAVI